MDEDTRIPYIYGKFENLIISKFTDDFCYELEAVLTDSMTNHIENVLPVNDCQIFWVNISNKYISQHSSSANNPYPNIYLWMNNIDRSNVVFDIITAILENYNFVIPDEKLTQNALRYLTPTRLLDELIKIIEDYYDTDEIPFQ